MRSKKQKDPNRGAMTVGEAGRKGGETVKAKYGHDFYAEIGRQGGEARKAQLGADGYAELGRRGGETVSQDREHMSEIGRRGGSAKGKKDDGEGGAPPVNPAPSSMLF